MSDIQSKLDWIDVVKWVSNLHNYTSNGLEVTPFQSHTWTCVHLVMGTSSHYDHYADTDVTIGDQFSWIVGWQMSDMESKLGWIDVKWVSNLHDHTLNGLKVTPFQPYTRTCLHLVSRGTSSHYTDVTSDDDGGSIFMGFSVSNVRHGVQTGLDRREVSIEPS